MYKNDEDNIIRRSDADSRKDSPDYTYETPDLDETPLPFYLANMRPTKRKESFYDHEDPERGNWDKDKETFEHRLKRFPGYLIRNLKCISQSYCESPVTSNTILEPLFNSSKVPGLLITNITSLLPKIKSERIASKIKYTVPEEAEKFHLSIIYVPECDIFRKQFIGFHDLNFQKLANEDFKNWCQKNALFNSKWMYESYFENGKPKECSFIRNGFMTIQNYDDITDLASRGNKLNVDTQIKDLLDEYVNSPLGKLPPEMPVFPFGKCMDHNIGLDDLKKEDVANSLVGLHIYDIIITCSNLSVSREIPKVYLCGDIFESEVFRKELQKILSTIFILINPSILDFDYSAVLGAMVFDDNIIWQYKCVA